MASDNDHEENLDAIKDSVSQKLQMAQATAKISDEDKDLLSQVIQTRRGNGEIVLDINALQRMKDNKHSWTSQQQKDQDRLINPTRLPQIIPSLKGLQPNQFLPYIQCPLDRDGKNADFLIRNTKRIADQYSKKELASERNRIFGRYQRVLAKHLIDSVLTKEFSPADEEALNQLRNDTPAQKQFELAAKELGISANEVMNRIYNMSVAVTLCERIKAKALRVKKLKPNFEKRLRTLVSENAGPTAKSRIRELFVGLQHDEENMGQEFHRLNKVFMPVAKKFAGDNFDETFDAYHLSAAKLDAIASRWLIIFAEADNSDRMAPIDRIKGMFMCFSE